jgi:predicted double-glycine peptidase
MKIEAQARRLGKIVLFSLLVLEAPGSAAGRPVRSLLEMRHENVVIQAWDLSCGAAALTTLLNYQHGERLTEKEVARGLMTREEYIKDPTLVQRREGFSLRDLKRQADTLGYVGKGFGQLQLNDLRSMFPVIVPIRTNGYNHFVVVRGMRGNRVLLADPAWGNRTMLISDFADRWIDYPRFGHVGFIVQRRDGLPASGRLSVQDRDFVSFR